MELLKVNPLTRDVEKMVRHTLKIIKNLLQDFQHVLTLFSRH